MVIIIVIRIRPDIDIDTTMATAVGTDTDTTKAVTTDTVITGIEELLPVWSRGIADIFLNLCTITSEMYR